MKIFKNPLVFVGATVVLLLSFLFWRTQSAPAPTPQPQLRTFVDRGLSPDAQLLFDSRLDALLKQKEELDTAGTRDITLLLRLGGQYYQMGLLTESASQYRDILSTHPNDAPALENLGQTLLEMEDYSGALESWQRAFIVFPTETTLVRIVDLIIQVSPDRDDRVGPLLEQGIATFGQKYDFMIRLGDWHARKGDYVRAVSHYEVALQLNENASARETLEIYRQKMREQEAVNLQQAN